MGRTKAEADQEQELQTKPTTNADDTVKASDIRDYYGSGSYSLAEVAEHFNVEESDVFAVLGKQAEEVDEFNQPKGKKTEAAE